MKTSLNTHCPSFMLTVLGLAVAIALPLSARAQKPAPSAASAAALDTLTQQAAPAAPIAARPQAPASQNPVTTAAPMAAGMHATLVVQPGQTLDMIIRQHLPQQPFKSDVIRRAIMDLNPSAFPLNTPHLIRAGAVLLLPTPEQIRQSAVTRNPVLAPYLGAADADSSNGPRSSRASNHDRRKWVRFP